MIRLLHAVVKQISYISYKLTRSWNQQKPSYAEKTRDVWYHVYETCFKSTCCCCLYCTLA